ncbi:glycosyl transferase [Streptomyces sp. NBC_00249]|uniref:nucleotide disphospho-sugar-binding domain-containing protein n=1 Tax=Streptomyces sp. NBC_00249 TaxID=2975690 RepID=UPI002251A5CF|nr:nucleotide disphospho-sugar-binding domain-containing protein [Streptomyces sp. NBC_00249]MCX5199471.1 glycosyl transferase [Streptomyces sp. NBC_00249]
MRVLVMTSPVPTHLTPVVPLAWALRAAGHEVLVACQPEVEAAARRAGLCVAVVEAVDDDSSRRERAAAERAAAGPGPSPAAGGDGPPWPVLAQKWRGRTAGVLAPSTAVARRWRPDLIVADPLEFAAPFVAADLGVPFVHHRWGVDRFGDERWRQARHALSYWCAARGPGALPEPALVLDPCPPGLQEPGLSAGGGIRFGAYNGSGSLPWRAAARGGRVCVTFGTRTVALDGAGPLRSTLRALGGTAGPAGPGGVVVAAAAGTGALLGRVPAGVELLEDVPLNLILGRCSLVVHHGGGGTTLTAASFGLPQLVLPQAPYLVEHGERLAACGAGEVLDRDAQETEGIRAAAERLLSSPRVAGAARRLAAEMGAMTTAAGWVAPLEEIAGRVRV